MRKHLSPVTHRSASKRRGAAIVEFAVVAPLFFLLLMAGIEFAMIATIRSTSHNAAYEAARELVIPGADAADGIAEAERIMSVVGVNDLTVTTTPSVIAEDTQEITVNISIPYANNAIFTPLFLGNLTLQSSITMRTERYDGFVVAP